MPAPPASASAPAPSSSSPSPSVGGRASGPGRPRPVHDEAAAIAALRAAWDEEVTPAARGPVKERVTQATGAIHEAARAHARRRPCREARSQVDGTLTPEERLVVIYYGDPPALDRAGACWEVEVPTSHFRSVLGYFDGASGALLFVWSPPEG